MKFENSSTKVIGLFVGRIIISVIGIIFVPIYVNIAGAESYGLIAFYATLSSAMLFLDLGLSTAISRQVTILSSTSNTQKEIKDLIFSVELIYWLIGAIGGALIILFSNYFANHWINSNALPIKTIQHTIMLMGVALAFQFPTSVYNGILTGLEKQITNTIVTVIFSVLRNIGVIPFLMFVDDSIYGYFIWQVGSIILMTLSLRMIVWGKFLSKKYKANFSKHQLKTIWKFAAGMTAISFITFFLREADKIIVSKMVLLEFVGYYNLAFMISSSLAQVISPLQSVFFPKLTALYNQGRLNDLKILYHKSARWISIIVFPLGMTLIVFAYDILFLWTNNYQLAKNTAPVLVVFTIGSILNCVMWLPYSYMIALGKTRFTIIQNLIAAAVIIPLLIFLTKNYGIYGCSFGWMILNIGYFLISAPLFHHLYLKGELSKWFIKDIAIPLLIVMAIIIPVKIFQLIYFTVPSTLNLFLLLFIALIIYSTIIPETRNILKTAVNK